MTDPKRNQKDPLNWSCLAPSHIIFMATSYHKIKPNRTEARGGIIVRWTEYLQHLKRNLNILRTFKAAAEFRRKANQKLRLWRAPPAPAFVVTLPTPMVKEPNSCPIACACDYDKLKSTIQNKMMEMSQSEVSLETLEERYSVLWYFAWVLRMPGQTQMAVW